MRNESSLIHLASRHLVLSLLVFGFTHSAMAVCVDSYSSTMEPQLATIVAVDANNGCDDITGQFGCSIKNPAVGDTCTYDDGTNQFTSTVTAFDALGIRWIISNNNVDIDTAMIGGGQQGKNNCAAFYTFEEDTGSGGDCKSFNNGTCTSYQNITSLDLCSDFVQETPPPTPPVAEPLGFCSDPNTPQIPGELDDTGVLCPTYQMGDPLPEGAAVGDQKPVVVCNFEKDKVDWGTTDGSDICCQCGIPAETQTACIVTEDRDQCAQSVTFNPTQSVQLLFGKDDVDPVTWIWTPDGWIQYSY